LKGSRHNKVQISFVTLWYTFGYMKKQTVLNTVNEFPKEIKLEELLERLVFMEKVENGLAQAKSGKTVEHTKVIERFRKNS